VSEENAGDESSVSREHLIAIEPDGMVTIAGGKLTTYRRMGAEVVDTVIDAMQNGGHPVPELRMAETDLNPLPGAVGWPEGGTCETVTDLILAAGSPHVNRDVATLLANTYGMRAIDVLDLIADDPTLATPLVAGRSEIEAQVVWAAREELAGTVSDVMIRRTQLFFRDRDQGLEAVERVTELLGDELGWSPDTRTHHAESYRIEVERSRRWRTE